MYQGSPVTAGQFAGWTPIGAEASGSGYLVAWKHTGTSEFKIWSVDGSGNYLSGDTVVSGAASALQSKEATFQQYLNGDGTLGFAPSVIESTGFGTLTQVGDTYRMSNSNSEVVLKYAGVAVTEGQFPGWVPVGAEPMGNTTSFRVAWKHVGTDEYKIWETDTNGNYVTGDVVLVGSTYTLQVKESGLGGQDINGDGVVGIKTTVIENSGSSSLVISADTYNLGGTLLKYAGTPVTVGMFAGWTPIGGEAGTVVWKSTSADQFRIWTVFTNGEFYNEVTVSGGTYSLQSREASFAQDLNADGRVGPLMTTIDSAGSTTLSIAADAYVQTFAGGTTVLSKDGAQVIVGQSNGWTPVAAENGEIVWKLSGADQFKVWQGPTVSGDGVTMSGTSAELKYREYTFQQDFNGDGQVLSASTIESTGTTVLRQVGDMYQLSALNGFGATLLKYFGSVVTEAQLGDWNLTGAERGATSSEAYLTLHNDVTGEYKIWLTDTQGNVKYDYGAMSGSDILLRTVEESMLQDLNSDGLVGLPDSPFDITLGYFGDSAYKLYVAAAAERWEQVITADLPSANNATYGLIDDVRIDVSVSGVDGAGGALAGGKPVFVRSSGNLTSYGTVTIDSSDIVSMAANGTLTQAVMHEMGHVLGIGSLWSTFGLVSNGEYTGQYGLEAYRELSGDASATFVPVETGGGSGTAGKH